MFKLLKNMRPKEIIMSIICIIFILGQIYFDLLLPDYMSELTTLINTVGSEINDIVLVGFKMIGCTLISAVLAILCGFLSSKIASGFSYEIRKKLFHHINDISKQEMQDFSIPSLITRTTNDISQIQMLVSMGLQMLIKSPVMAIWAIIKILNKSWELSIVTMAYVVVLCAFILIIMSICLPRFRLVQKFTDKINKVTRENLQGINVVHAFNAEDYQNNKFDDANKKMNSLQLKNQKLFACMQPSMSLCMNSLSLVIYWLGATLINNMSSTSDRLVMFSNVVVFSTYATYVIMSFMMLIMIFMILPSAQVSAERINEVLAKQTSIKEGSVIEGTSKGTIKFNNVYFSYPKTKEDELVNINFEVNQGETLAIIGPTGSGKTTLVNLISRLYDVTSGEVLIDGLNIKDYEFSSLYHKIGYISQKAMLFSGSVEDNVFFGEEKNKDILNEALEISQASEFVNKLDDKENYRVAQLGRNLSGGQKQRLSIARAIARHPEILIFDDSFSALDYKTDALLREELKNKLKDTTKVIVTQRVSTIRHADKIIVLNNGEIVGIGRHEELMKNCSLYQEIAHSQLSNTELEG